MRAGSAILVLVLAGGLAVASADKPTLPPEELVLLLREARIQKDSGKIDEARALYWRALEEYPGEGAALLAINSFCARHPLTDEDTARFRSNLEAWLLDADSVMPYSLLRQLAEDPEADDLDLELARRAVEIRLKSAPDDPRLLDVLVLIQIRLDEDEDARETLGHLLKLKPTGPVFWRCIRLDMKLERWDSALALLEKTLAERGEDVWARTVRLDLLGKTGRVDQLLADIDAIEVDKLPRSTLPNLIDAAWVLRDRDQNEGAERLFRAALKIDPENEIANAAILHLYASPEERAAHAATIESRWGEEENPDELVREGAARLASGDAVSAYDLLSRATTISPGDELAWLNLGIAASRLERWTEAAGALEKAAEINPDRPETLTNLGTAYGKVGRCAEAIAPLQRAIELRPDSLQAHYYLYFCFKETGDPRSIEALETYQKLSGG